MKNTAYALARLAYSGGLIAAPERLAGPWLGAKAAGRPATQIALRGLAARDAALATAVLGCAVTGRDPRLWLVLCAVGDAADLAATLAAPPADLPPHARRGTIALAGGSAVLGLLLALRS
ncbi:MAG: hypothetical protein LC720_01060 [Actinobacteria bacterium]|nr:hypothetical protein [Actinomycetota bacterium]